MSASFDRTKEKYAKRNEVTYEKDDEGEEQIVAKSIKGGEVETIRVKNLTAPSQSKPKNNAVYKYSKKNTQFKKKK